MVDVIVIGGGPAGLYSAFYCGLRGLSVQLIEGQSFLGGKLNVYKEKNVWDIGGLVGQPAKDIIKSLITQAETFNPEFILGQSVTDIIKEEKQFCVKTHNGDMYYSKAVIIGTGTGISVPTKLDLDNHPIFDTTNIHYDLPENEILRDKVVMISGSNAKAVRWAKEISTIAKKIYFIYRMDLQKGSSIDIDSLMESENIVCIKDKKISELVSRNDDRICSVSLSETKELIEIDELLVSHGVKKSNPLIKEDTPFDLEKKTYFNIDDNGETSVEGIFAAGDAAIYEGKLRMIAESFHDAIKASNAVAKKLDPKAAERGKVSSHHEELRKRKSPKSYD